MTDIELYNQAKEAYYNGTPIMEDFEFDELEKRLGLENKSYVGAKHNPSYTVKHPYIMGSLSKVQIHKDKDNNINWPEYYSQIVKYVGKCPLIITPKFDGCSFEAVVHNGKVISISTRGDGDYGKDIYNHLINKFYTEYTGYPNDFTLRGEVLINKTVFAQKYSEFVNPRSFVSGLLNRDYDANDTDFIDMLNDLSIVIYDTRINDNGTWKDIDWNAVPFTIHDTPEYFQLEDDFNVTDLERIYYDFAEYRENCPFALDGIVLKPVEKYRTNNLTEHRPKDCVAIKFVPMLQETEVVDIVWSMRKTNELRPVIVVKPVIMDGKEITKASAHNWGYCIENGINIGTKVILSLAGDIIPFIYKITKPSDNLELLNTVPYDRKELEIHDCHLCKILTKEELNRQKFVSSAAALNIPSIGTAAANTIYDYMIEECKGDEFFGVEAKETPNNILLVRPADVERALNGKLGMNARKAMLDYLKNITIKDIIVSCTFESCGPKVAEQIEKQILFGTGNYEHLAEKAYKWALDINSPEIKQVTDIMDFVGINLDDYRTTVENTEPSMEQIPVILTGEPNDYKSKGEFLKCHPEYRNTTSWKEVKIVFTNSLESTTGKMKKAIEKGIEIKLY